MYTCRDKNIKGQQQKHQQKNRNFECQNSMFANHHICVGLRSSLHHIGSWICPKFMHKSKYLHIYHAFQIATEKPKDHNM